MKNSITVMPEETTTVSSDTTRFIKPASYRQGGGPDNGWSVMIILEGPADATRLNFRFGAFVQRRDLAHDILDPNEILGPCVISIPRGHYVSKDGKTLTVYYTEDQHEEDVAGAMMRLRNHVEKICREADAIYFIGKHTRLITLR